MKKSLPDIIRVGGVCEPPELAAASLACFPFHERTETFGQGDLFYLLVADNDGWVYIPGRGYLNFM